MNFIEKIKEYVFYNLPSYFKSKEKTLRNITKITEYLAEDTEKANIDFNIQTATGTSLDLYGALLPIKRKDGENDETYRASIKFEMSLRSPTITQEQVIGKIKMLFDCEKIYVYPQNNNIVLIYIKYKIKPYNIDYIKTILPAGVNFVFKTLEGDYIKIYNKEGKKTFVEPIKTENNLLLTDENGVPICADFFEQVEIF